MKRAKLLLSIAAVSTVIALFPEPSDAAKVVYVPLRWCACEGSPLFDHSPLVPSFWLFSRHTDADDAVWIPEAKVSFRSGITAKVAARREFPIIPDPRPPVGKLEECGDTEKDPPPPSGPGECGDIRDPDWIPPGGTKEDRDDSEYKELIAACDAAWDKIDILNNANTVGPIAVNIRRFVDPGGTPTNLGGWGGGGTTLHPNDADLCTEPTLATSVSGGGLAIVDNWNVVPGGTTETWLELDPVETLLAHELGHVLRLGHGNGEDDDGNDSFETAGCDKELLFEQAEPKGIMTPGGKPGKVENIGDKHAEHAKAFADVYIGAREIAAPPDAAPGDVFASAQVLQDGDIVGDHRVDVVRDVSYEEIDILYVGILENRTEQYTAFHHRLIGLFPESDRNDYVAFWDLDGNPATGGAPADLGFPTEFQGADLVTKVYVAIYDPDVGLELAGIVWRHDGTDFVLLDHTDFTPTHEIALVGHEQDPSFSVLSIVMDNTVRGPMSDEVRFQAFARKLVNPTPGILNGFEEVIDWLPDLAAGEGVVVRPIPPVFPTCDVTPLESGPGQTVTVNVSDMPENEGVKVYLGGAMVAEGQTDELGTAAIEFTVPFGGRDGNRLVNVIVDETILTADCFVNVAGPAQVPIDVKPGSCPNPINTRSRGVIPVAIAGDTEFNVTNINQSTIRFLGATPLRTKVSDVTTPFTPNGEALDCLDCLQVEPDGIPDLLMHFRTQDVVAGLGEVEDRDCFRGIVTANLDDGTAIAGEDRLWILKRTEQLRPGDVDSQNLLWAMYPNPMRPGQSATLYYSVSHDAASVKIGLYNVAGRLVRNLVNGTAAAGTHHLEWNGRDDSGRQVHPGVYFIKMQIGSEQRRSQLLILR